MPETEAEYSAIVENMKPRWDLTEGDATIRVISREAFRFILECADSDEEHYIGFSNRIFGTDDGRAVRVLCLQYTTDEERAVMIERFKSRGLYKEPTVLTEEEQHDIDMERSDRLWRRTTRNLLARTGVKSPHFLETNWRVYDRIGEDRERRRTWYQRATHDVILHRDRDEQRSVFIAEDSEMRFRQGK